MMPDGLLRHALLEPQALTALSLLDWDLLIRQGRRANLLARLALLLESRDLLAAVPQAPRQHLISAIRVSERQGIAVRWEVECIAAAFAGTGVPVVLLKGAAYLISGHPASAGRMFADIDIIVPKPLIGRAESALMQHGWRGAELTAYDQRYYRRWMHEIPPMTHVRRGTTVDVHHSILPDTARAKVDAAALLDAAVDLVDWPGVKVLQPVDMLLHSAAHLFQEGEFENGLRDLFDLDCLMRNLGAGATRGGDPWQELVPRAIALGLGRPLHYALRYTTMLLDTPVPRAVIEAARVSRPSLLVGALMDACYRRALQPVHASTGGWGTSAARLVLYLRSHWQRMPPHLLTYHLGRKALMKLLEKQPELPGNPPPGA